MYENLIHQQSRSNYLNNFSVRLPPMPVDEKVAYVESVCAALIDERFGRRMSMFIIDMSELPEFEDKVFGEISDEEIVPSYVAHPYSEMARRDAADIIRNELAQLRLSTTDAPAPQSSPPNLGRGSPQISLGRIACP